MNYLIFRFLILLLTVSIPTQLFAFSFGNSGGVLLSKQKKEDTPVSEQQKITPKTQKKLPIFTTENSYQDNFTEIKIDKPTPTFMVHDRTNYGMVLTSSIPTFVDTYHNPNTEIQSVSYGTAATAGVISGVVGIGIEVYRYNRNGDPLNYSSIAKTGTVFSTASFSGVVASQTAQRAILVNAPMMGLSASSASGKIFAGFTGDLVGGGVASGVFSMGSYISGNLGAAEAKQALYRGAVGSVIMAGGKNVGTYAFTSLAGTSGVAATGPYIIAYAATIGAIYLTDVVFESIDKQEEGERLVYQIQSMKNNE